MPISRIVDFCRARYNRAVRCAGCRVQCVGCETCLDNMHFRRTPRRYGCTNISNFYVCKYIYKYASEIDYLLNAANFQAEFNSFTEYKVLSVGCGPSTEFFGFLSNRNRHALDKTLSFMGLDFNRIWETIHQEIQTNIVPTLVNVRTRFVYSDGLDYLRNYQLAQNPPNVLLLQYVLSDIQSHGGDIADFINLIVTNVVPSMPVGSVIIVNDINLQDPRDYFDRLHSRLTGSFDALSFSFANNNRGGYRYGTRHPQNDVLYPIPVEVLRFNPWTFCSSAQMILKKRV